MKAIFLMLLLAIVVALSHKVGMDKGYAEGVKSVPPAPRVTDQQCVAWLFDTNLKDVKKRICK